MDKGGKRCYILLVKAGKEKQDLYEKTSLSINGLGKGNKESMDRDQKMKWFRDARYGMFIHWGLYAIPAGAYQGVRYPFGSEWIMKNAHIPLAEYKKYAEQFNPTLFSAKDWVYLAAEAGMKYLVFTAKHHDGFAMYHSQCSNYNIVDATPFGRDVVRELAEECKRQGIVFCLYYSQYQDWEHPNGYGNDWDRDAIKKEFPIYFEQRVKPQIRELLTQYGPVGLLWFDTPYDMEIEYCRELVDYVHTLQPDCIINGRVGYYLGDYRQMGDNSIPAAAFPEDWETPMTLNDTWGYKDYDQNFKSPADVIKMLVNVVSKNGNLLLNVGPDALGNIPEKSVEILREVGKWLKVNGESIYGTTLYPALPYELDWGKFTYKDHKMYMHIFQWPITPYEILVYGFKTKVKKAYLLSDPKKMPLPVAQSFEIARDQHRLRIRLPEQQIDPIDTVAVLELDGEPEVYNT